MDNEEQKHRLYHREQSDASKLAWKRHHGSYMRGIARREREKMNKSFYAICKEFDESEISKDNVFDTELNISLDNIAGGISMSVNRENGNVSISTSLEQTGSGQYRLTQYDDETLKTLYNNMKSDLTELCKSFDEELAQILAKNGLRSTK